MSVTGDMMDYLRGKIKSGSPGLLNDDVHVTSADTWRTRSALRRRDDIFSSAYRLDQQFNWSIKEGHHSFIIIQ